MKANLATLQIMSAFEFVHASFSHWGKTLPNQSPAAKTANPSGTNSSGCCNNAASGAPVSTDRTEDVIEGKTESVMANTRNMAIPSVRTLRSTARRLAAAGREESCDPFRLCCLRDEDDEDERDRFRCASCWAASSNSDRITRR